MKRTVFFIFLLSLLLMQNIESEENIKKNNRAFEFSLGAGISHSLGINNSHYVDYEYDYSYTSINPMPRFQSISLCIPLSTVFYPNKFFGIGGLYLLEVDFNTSQPSFPFYFPLEFIYIQNKIRLVMKIGNYFNYRNWLLLEAGVVFCNSVFSIYYFYYDNNRSSFSFGPSLFIGYENNGLNITNYSMAVGLTVDMLYERYGDMDNYMVDNFNLYVGIEVRFRFSYFKEFNGK